MLYRHHVVYGRAHSDYVLHLCKKGRQINIPHLRTNHYTTLTSTQASCGFIVEFTQVQSEIFFGPTECRNPAAGSVVMF